MFFQRRQVERPQHGAPGQRPRGERHPLGAAAPGRALPEGGEELGARRGHEGLQVLRTGGGSVGKNGGLKVGKK